jgi:hypothetical protein
MEKEYIETMDDLKKYLNSDEYKSMEKEIMELVKKSEINNIKYACSFVYDDKDNIIGRFRNIEKENEQKWKKQN